MMGASSVEFKPGITTSSLSELTSVGTLSSKLSDCELFAYKYAKNRLFSKKNVAIIAVMRVMNEPEPREPNTVPEAPPPNPAPAVAPLPC